MRASTMIALVALGSIGAFVAGRTSTPSRVSTQVLTPSQQAPDSEVVLAKLEHLERMVVAQTRAVGVVAERATTAIPAATTEARPAEPPAPNHEQVRAFDDGQSRVEASLAVGAWTDDDASYIGDRLGTMSHEQRQQVIEQVIVALNSGKLARRFSGRAPF